jgi:hypothetical protein
MKAMNMYGPWSHGWQWEPECNDINEYFSRLVIRIREIGFRTIICLLNQYYIVKHANSAIFVFNIQNSDLYLLIFLVAIGVHN